MAVTFVNAYDGTTSGVVGLTFDLIGGGGNPPAPPMLVGAFWVDGGTITKEMSELENYPYYPNFEATGDLYIDGVLKSDGIWTPVDGQTVTLDNANWRIDVVSPGGGVVQ